MFSYGIIWCRPLSIRISSLTLLKSFHRYWPSLNGSAEFCYLSMASATSVKLQFPASGHKCQQKCVNPSVFLPLSFRELLDFFGRILVLATSFVTSKKIQKMSTPLNKHVGFSIVSQSFWPPQPLPTNAKMSTPLK